MRINPGTWLSGAEWARWLGFTPRYPAYPQYTPFAETPEYRTMWRDFQRQLEAQAREAQTRGGAAITQQLAQRGFQVSSMLPEYYNRLAQEIQRQQALATGQWTTGMAQAEAQRRLAWERGLQEYNLQKALAEAQGKQALFSTIFDTIAAAFGIRGQQQYYNTLKAILGGTAGVGAGGVLPFEAATGFLV